jgi:predicted Zn-dependent protease
VKLKLYLLIFPGFFWVAFSSGQNLPDLGDVSTDDLSSAQESILGAEIMRRVRTANTFVSDSEISQYLADLGYKLVSMSSDPDQRFEFFLVNDSVINAFALPGGYVGIHSGLVLSSKTESELAGVIAHEVAHVQQRHVARMLTAQKKLGVASLAGLGLAILASRSSGQLAEAALVASQAAPMHAMLRFSRDHEREADRVGLGIIVAAGFDPYATVDFFNELYRETRIYQNDLPGYLRTHPMTYERIGDLKSRLNSFEKRKIPSSLHYLLIKAPVKL